MGNSRADSSPEGIKKICLVIPSLQAGGMERVMSELAGHFCTISNLDVHLVLYGSTCEIFYEIPANLVVHKPVSPFNHRFRTLSTINRLFFLRKAVKRIDPDTVLSFGEVWNSFVLLALLFLRYPVYISDRCNPMRKYKPVNRLLRKVLYPRAEGIIAQTHTARQIYREQFGKVSIAAIANPIRFIGEGIEEEKENIVLMVGRFIRSKNQDRLIDMFLAADVPGWRLVLVGYDHLNQNYGQLLADKIEQNDAKDRVILAGKQSQVDYYYKKSRIFAFTSGSEGFPNAIGEAMSAALPVIAFDCIAGPSEMITDNYNGYLIPVSDYQLFAVRLRELMLDKDKRLQFGKNGIESISRYSVDRIGDAYLSFILNQARPE